MLGALTKAPAKGAHCPGKARVGAAQKTGRGGATGSDCAWQRRLRGLDAPESGPLGGVLK